MFAWCRLQWPCVNRRVGGLEDPDTYDETVLNVNRRVGGLEVNYMINKSFDRVNRRVGGLEDKSPTKFQKL